MTATDDSTYTPWRCGRYKVGSAMLDFKIRTKQPADTGARDVHVDVEISIVDMPITYASSWTMHVPFGSFYEFMVDAELQTKVEFWPRVFVWHFFDKSHTLRYVAHIPMKQPRDLSADVAELNEAINAARNERDELSAKNAQLVAENTRLAAAIDRVIGEKLAVAAYLAGRNRQIITLRNMVAQLKA